MNIKQWFLKKSSWLRGGNIKAVHIEDAQGGDVVVWPDNKTLTHPLPENSK